MKNVNYESKSQGGFSLLEMLVVITIFSMLAVVSSQAVILTLRGALKAKSTAVVRQNLDYSIALMERQFHNARDVSPCPNDDTAALNLTDPDGATASFSCVLGEDFGYIASSSARITNDEVKITKCSITCGPALGNVPQSVKIDLIGESLAGEGSQKARVELSTQVFLRSY